MSTDRGARATTTAVVERGAVIDRDGVYRYELTRRWGDGAELVWVMCNPSIADGHIDDPTIRRCIGFSASWGFASLRVVNIFALRSTDPRPLRRHEEPESNGNLEIVMRALADTEWALAAWGALRPSLTVRSKTYAAVNAFARDTGRVRCLGTTMHGEPRHPLYRHHSTTPLRWAPLSVRSAGGPPPRTVR
jgi:hypothetical protein